MRQLDSSHGVCQEKIEMHDGEDDDLKQRRYW